MVRTEERHSMFSEPMREKKILTLCMIYKGGRILLGMKKRGFGAGYWNGFGGKVRPDESVEEGMLRETQEEIGITLLRFEKKGILGFHFENDPVLLEGHIFTSSDFEGEPVESEEMEPCWFAFEKIPYEKMWPGDKHWIPWLLQEKIFTGDFYFKNAQTLLDYNLKEVEPSRLHFRKDCLHAGENEVKWRGLP